MGQSADTPQIRNLDRWGMWIAAACIVHCLALPLLAAALPFVAVILPHDEWTHTAMLALALPVTGMALVRGYRRHRLVRPAALGAAGLLLIAGALLTGGGAAETAMTVTGALLCAAAHVLNWRGHRPGNCGG